MDNKNFRKFSPPFSAPFRNKKKGVIHVIVKSKEKERERERVESSLKCTANRQTHNINSSEKLIAKERERERKHKKKVCYSSSLMIYDFVVYLSMLL
jgi:hypothetical protein